MGDQLKREARFRLAAKLTRIGLVANLVLMAGKLLVGHFGRSSALFADGIESACDLSVSVASLVTLRFTRNPCDSRHPYGHGRAESLAEFLVGLVIIATSVWIVSDAVITVAGGVFTRPHWLTVVVAALTIIIKESLARLTFGGAERLHSPVLNALAHDHRKDAITSIGTLAGCGAALLGMGRLDPVFAGLTGLLIAHVGMETIRKAVADLIDAALPGEKIEAISAVAESVAGVEHVHEIRGRRSGQFIIVDLKLDMDPEMTVRHSHEIATLVKQKIFDADPCVGDVMIHINPHNDPDHEDMIRL